MPIFIDLRKDRSATCWRRLKMAGVTEEAAKRRIKCFFVHSREELLTLAAAYTEPSSLVLLLASNKEIREAKAEYADIPMPIIVFAHHIYDPLADEFSYVMSDLSGSMRRAMAHLEAQGATRPALFAVNYHSNHDYCRVQTFKRITGIEDPLVFDLSQGVTVCVRKLLACKEPIDALLCTNDFCALRLMHVLDMLDMDWNRKMLMLGFTDSNLSALHAPALTSTSLNYFAAGQEVVSLHRRLAKNTEVAHLHTVMESKLQKRESTAAFHPCGIRFSELAPLNDAALADSLRLSDRAMVLENLLGEADDTTLRLLLGLLREQSTERIAAELFFSKDNVLYHLRKIRHALHTESTKELCALLRRWVDADALEAYIQ